MFHVKRRRSKFHIIRFLRSDESSLIALPLLFQMDPLHWAPFGVTGNRGKFHIIRFRRSSESKQDKLSGLIGNPDGQKNLTLQVLLGVLGIHSSGLHQG